MSVPLDQRDESKIQYITTVQSMYNTTVKKLSKLPGKYHIYYYTPIANYLLEALDKVAFGRFLTSPYEAKDKEATFKRARHSVIMAAKLMDGLKEALESEYKPSKSPVSASFFGEWFGNAKKEIDLITGVLNATKT